MTESVPTVQEEQSTHSPPRARKDVPIQPSRGSYIIDMDEEPEEQKTEAGIIVTQFSDDFRASTGRIAAVGDSPERAEYEVGDRVYFSPYGGHEVRIGTDEFIQLAETEILGKFVEDGNVEVR